jgi:hypothetical protein
LTGQAAIRGLLGWEPLEYLRVASTANASTITISDFGRAADI